MFGKYSLLEKLAVGGMAELYKAKIFGAAGFEKQMVVKQILPQFAQDEEFVKMFVTEAKIAVSLSHGNIVPVYELGNIAGTYYIAMEYVHGRDLGEVLHRSLSLGQSLPVEVAVYIAIEICKGLDYAHRKVGPDGRSLDIVHRDISPPNVLLSFDGEVKIVDFGIAKATYSTVMTKAGMIKGKFGYMSPEQARGLPLDGRSDLFSAGILLFEVLTGRQPFQAETEVQTLDNVKAAKVPSPSRLNADIPPMLDKIVFKALAREPEDRYATADELARALSKFLFSQGWEATRTTLAELMRRLFPESHPEGGVPMAPDEPQRAPPSAYPAMARGDGTSATPTPLASGLGEVVQVGIAFNDAKTVERRVDVAGAEMRALAAEAETEDEETRAGRRGARESAYAAPRTPGQAVTVAGRPAAADISRAPTDPMGRAAPEPSDLFREETLRSGDLSPQEETVQGDRSSKGEESKSAPAAASTSVPAAASSRPAVPTQEIEAPGPFLAAKMWEEEERTNPGSLAPAQKPPPEPAPAAPEVDDEPSLVVFMERPPAPGSLPPEVELPQRRRRSWMAPVLTLGAFAAIAIGVVVMGISTSVDGKWFAKWSIEYRRTQRIKEEERLREEQRAKAPVYGKVVLANIEPPAEITWDSQKHKDGIVKEFVAENVNIRDPHTVQLDVPPPPGKPLLWRPVTFQIRPGEVNAGGDWVIQDSVHVFIKRSVVLDPTPENKEAIQQREVQRKHDAKVAKERKRLGLD